MTVRPMRPEDVPAVVCLVRELAEYEKSLPEARLTEELLAGALFGDSPALFGHVAIAEDGVHPGVVVGMALWFLNFSTWRGTHGIYLEDLHVRPGHRGRGFGTDLLRTLAAICAERGYSRLEWSVLDWNESAHQFYEAQGAVPMDEWTVWRLTDDALERFGRSSA